MDLSIIQNNKIKSDILNIIINSYNLQYLNICSHNFIILLKKILISNIDNIVREKCIFLLKEIYSNFGENLWNYIQIDDKIKEIIEENYNNGLNNKRISSIEYNKNNLSDENNLLKKYNTQNNNIIKNIKNEIYYKNFINFNSNFQDQKQFNKNYSHEKKFINKIRVKKSPLNKIFLMNKKSEKNYIKEENNNNYFLKNTDNSFYKYNCHSNECNDCISYRNNILTKEELIIKMNNLFSENYLIKINSIIILHEILCLKYEENKYIILNNIEQIMDIFIKIIRELFYDNNYLEDDFNINFINYTKYIVTTISKLLSNRELIENISYKTIYTLSEEILNCLLAIDDINENENNKEKSIIFKTLNNSIKTIFENYNITSILLILLELITNYYNKNTKNNNIFILTILKYLENKIQNIDIIIPHIEMDAILLQIHLLLNKLNKYLPDLNPQNEIDIMIIKYIKKFILEATTYKKEKILEDYNRSVKCHFLNDKYIIRWINEYMLNKNKEKKSKDIKFKKINDMKNFITRKNHNKNDKKMVTSISNKNIRQYK